MDELDFLLSVDSGGLEIHTEGQAVNNNIAEWLDTPEGTIANNVSWGHNLKPYQYEPEGEETAVLIEMAIISKLPRDVKGVNIAGIRVTFPEFDKCLVQIRHQYGTFQRTTTR